MRDAQDVLRGPFDDRYTECWRRYFEKKEGSRMTTNYDRLFGTPEKAVETLAAIETCCHIDWDCGKCPLDGVVPSCVFCGADDGFKAATLEWLREEWNGE